MLKQTRTLLLIIITLSFAAIAVNGQTPTNVSQPTDSADDTRTTQPATNGGECADCNQRLLKALNDLDAADAALAAKEEELKRVYAIVDAQQSLIKRREEIEAAQDKQIELLKKKAARKVSILFGLIKIHY